MHTEYHCREQEISHLRGGNTHMMPDWLKNLHAGEQQRKQAEHEAALQRELEIIDRHDELVDCYFNNIMTKINNDIHNPYFLYKNDSDLSVTKKLFGYEVNWHISTIYPNVPTSTNGPKKIISILESNRLQADVTSRVLAELQRLGFKKICIYFFPFNDGIATIIARF